jgi:LuxR family maltose regulon positive regulatory protein
MPTNSIIRTKLFRPTVGDDIVARPRLFRKLEKGSKCRLTLVSAPAGSGKSLLASSWLESCDRPNGWLSLDDEIRDLTSFLRYFLFAVRGIFPEACPNTLALLGAPGSPTPQVLAAELVSELQEIKSPYVLVLDDYGYIHDPDIHEVLNKVVKNAPPTLQMVVLTRRDPPLPLHALRAGGDLVEVRQKDLRFTLTETAAFLEKAVDSPVEESAVKRLNENVEGWAAGLRLVALSLESRDDVDGLLREMKGDTRHIQEYLLAEVLSRQPKAMRTCLLKTSILDRFCASLCSALCHSDCKELCGPECDGQAFMDKLEESNLFCIALDEKHEWLRYHHLFQQLLQRTLRSRYGSGEVEALHDRARDWFEENGMIEEAVRHAMKGSAPAEAGKQVARHRHDLMNGEQWHRLRGLLHLLPRNLVDEDPELIIAEAWTYWNQMRIPEMAAVLDRLEPQLSGLPKKSIATEEVQAEADTLRCVQHYFILPEDRSRPLLHARRALQGNALRQPAAKGFATIMLAYSLQLTGKSRKAFEIIFNELKEKDRQTNTYFTRMLITLCFLYWMEADLGNVMQVSAQVTEIGKELDLPESTGVGHYFQGLGHYILNEQEEAVRHLRKIASAIDNASIFNFVHGSFALSLSLHAQGRPDRAREAVDTVADFALKTGNKPVLQLAHACRAELALRDGKISEATLWAGDYEPEPFGAAHRFYIPQLTLARILVAGDGAGSRHGAFDFLSRLHDYYESTHNRYCLLNVLALQARLHLAHGDEETALEAMERAVVMAEPGRHIRIFLDLGPATVDILQQLAQRGVAPEYIDRLLSAFRLAEPGPRSTTVKASNKPSLPVGLTKRELAILALLADRLSNNEISDRLFISPETVKRHVSNLYLKFDVHGRREAVKKAYSLGILSRG